MSAPMIRAITLSVLLFLPTGFSPAEICKCRKPKVVAGSETSEYKRVEEYIYKEFYGKVTSLGDRDFLIEGILIEVYDHPEVAVDSKGTITEGREVKQKKLAACRTDQDGMFCFKGIKPGRYELRLIDDRSVHEIKSGPWENRSWFITLDPKHPESTEKMIEVYMTLRI